MRERLNGSRCRARTRGIWTRLLDSLRETRSTSTRWVRPEISCVQASTVILRDMRASKRYRDRRRTLVPPPADVDLPEIAARASYVGSSEHKSYPSFAGPPKLRADATKCDPALADPAELTQWLREAIMSGRVGPPWLGDFHRYVWYLRGDICYEGMLVNQGLGQYKGYQLERDQWPEGL
jgi:hypothetical protein